MSVSAAQGYEFDFSAMFDRVDHPAAGCQGGQEGAPTFIHHDDGTPMKGKGRQFVPAGTAVVMGFPGGAGYGDARARTQQAIRRDLALGYISAASARQDYGLCEEAIEEVAAQVAAGETF